MIGNIINILSSIVVKVSTRFSDGVTVEELPVMHPPRVAHVYRETLVLQNFPKKAFE